MLLDHDPDECDPLFECQGDNCHEDVKYRPYGYQFCKAHYETYRELMKRQQLDRHCAHCETTLEFDVPLNRKYCSERCKNNARRSREGLSEHEEHGPMGENERILRAANKVRQERYGLPPVPSELPPSNPIQKRFLQMCKEWGVDPKTGLPKEPPHHVPLQDLGH